MAIELHHFNTHGMMCFFIGFFFGRVTKNRIEMKKDECKTYEDIIDREG